MAPHGDDQREAVALPVGGVHLEQSGTRGVVEPVERGAALLALRLAGEALEVGGAELGVRAQDAGLGGGVGSAERVAERPAEVVDGGVRPRGGDLLGDPRRMLDDPAEGGDERVLGEGVRVGERELGRVVRGDARC